MAVRADMISNRKRVQRAMQAVGFVALLILAVGAVLTTSGAFAGGLGANYASLVKPAHAAYAPMDTDTPTSTDTPTPTSTPNPCDPVWSVVSSPSVGTSSNVLNDVEVVMANDVWAVGYVDQNPAHTLVEHWDGTEWSVVPSPNPGTNGSSLYGVAAVSANDLWAVGYYMNGSIRQTLIEHWDGTSWSVVSSPNVGTFSNQLYGVAAVSANDVWAVGYYNNASSIRQTLVEHWDGTSWSVVPSPSAGTAHNSLYGVAAVSAHDLWAVGYYSNSAYQQTLVEHWDGTSWSVVSSPSPCCGSYLYGVAVVSANDVWAVGGYNGGRTLIEHWDGTSWSVVPSPNLGGGYVNYLYGVTAVSASDVWAVGDYFNGSGYQTLIEHWDGISWSVVSSPNVGTGDNQLYGVAAVSANDVWAVGEYATGSGVYRTLVEHYASLCGTPTNTPTPTITPTITRTSTITNTPTDTPTNTPTITPGGPTLTPTLPAIPIHGHLTWQLVSPANRPSVTGTLALCVNGSTQTFNFTTDTGGNFTVTTTLPDGTYHWRTKGGRHLSNSSPLDGADLVISNGHATQEFGTQKGGDAVGAGNSPPDNIINSLDYSALKTQFGQAGYRSADFDYNQVVNGSDFSFIKTSFGQAGHALTCP